MTAVRLQIHAILGLFVYTPLIIITGMYALTGDGVLCYVRSIDDDEKRADVLAVLAEHGLK